MTAGSECEVGGNEGGGACACVVVKFELYVKVSRVGVW